jgi:hypothetical protein
MEYVQHTSADVILGLWEIVHGELPPRTHAKPGTTLSHHENTSWAEVFLHSYGTWALSWHRVETLEKAVRVSPKLRLILGEADRLDPEILRKRNLFWESVRQREKDQAYKIWRKEPEFGEKSLRQIAQSYRWW